MAEATPSTEIQRTAVRLQELIDRLGGEGAIIGGVAVGLASGYRGTRDVDAILWAESLDPRAAVEAAAEMEIESRVSDVISDARTILVMRLRDRQSSVPIDLSLAYTPFEREVIDRSELIETPHGAIRVATAEDLVIMKAVAHRPQDLADLAKIVEVSAGLNWVRIEHWIREFGEALDQPDLWDKVRNLARR